MRDRASLEEPKPCPFCESKAQLRTSRAVGGFEVICGKPGSVYEPKEGCGARSHVKQTRAEALAAWNNRP